MQLGLFIIITIFVTEFDASHFRGASFTWSPNGGNSITVNFRISWRRSSGYFCDDSTVSSGTLVSDSYNAIKCESGCTGTVGYLHFKCTDYSTVEDWTTGRNTITYTSTVPMFSFRFSSGDWIALLAGGSSWSLLSTVNLAVRSDTGKINSSPTVDVPPLLNWQSLCSYNFQLPVSDVDGDIVRCRWAAGTEECGSVCNTFPGAVLNTNNCTITYTAVQTIGYYAVALQIEDFATVSSTTPLSSIPLQFLVKIYSGSGCSAAPEFVSPTPDSNDYFNIFVGNTITISLRARSSIGLRTITTTSAVGMVRSAEVTTQDSNWKYMSLSVSWTPTFKDAEQDHTLCFYATDIFGSSSKTQCVHVQVSDINECQSAPCQNGGVCTDKINRYLCTCAAGYTGNNCELEIDECLSSPCLNGGTCSDRINGYTCACKAGFEGSMCEIDKDECASNPCQNNGVCSDGVNTYECSCLSGFSGLHCETDIDECTSTPCQNGGECFDQINSYTCTCSPGFSGKICETEINECLSQPCRNGGSCTDIINGYICSCSAGFSGRQCELDINECESNPCRNNGVCNDQVNKYSCSCSPRFYGVNCQKVGGHKGTEFYIAMITIYNGNEDIRVDIVAEEDGKGALEVTAKKLSEINITAGVTTVFINNSLVETGTFTDNRGVRITTDVEVSMFVTGIDKLSSSIREVYLVLPVTALDNIYQVASYQPADFVARSEYIILSMFNSTTVNITNAYSGNMTTVVLNELDVHQRSDEDDLSYDSISADKKIAVISGTSCAYVPENVRACNFMIEEMIPSRFWSHLYIVPSLFPKTGYVIRILTTTGSQIDICFINATTTTCHHHDNHERSEYIFEKDPVVILSRVPFSVIQYGVSERFDGIPGGPFMMTIPGINHYRNEYRFAVPDVQPKSINFLTVIVRSSQEKKLVFDGEFINDTFYKQSVSRPMSSYTILKVIVDEGYHTLSHKDKDERFGAFIYGIDEEVGYGYPLGFEYGDDIELCSISPCQNEGSCLMQNLGFTCMCQAGFTGTLCQTDINECISHSCKNGATCVDLIHGYRCVCVPGYEGSACEIDINECGSNPCLNDGTCNDVLNGYVCQCVAGYTGTSCETDIDDCSSKPCQNSGTCVDLVDAYRCLCTTKYSGTNCQTRIAEINECHSNPCQNGGSCIDQLDGYVCSCVDGTNGRHCEFDIDECNSNPCQNAGSCTDRINGFECTCNAWTHGLTCQYASSHIGSEFFIGMPAVYNGTFALQVDIASQENGLIYVEFADTSRDFKASIQSGITRITVYPERKVNAGDTSALGVRLRTSVDVSIIVSRKVANDSLDSDAYLGLPVPALGKLYKLMSNFSTKIAQEIRYVILGIHNDTTITLNSDSSEAFTIHINQFDMFEEEYNATTVLIGDKQFAVIAGISCTTCGFMTEQIIPVEFWTNYYIIPSVLPLSNFTVNVLGSKIANNTLCIENDTENFCSNFDHSNDVLTYTSLRPTVVKSNSHVNILLVSEAGFILEVPGVSNYRKEYSFLIPNNTVGTHVLCIMIPTSADDGLFLDGQAVDSVLEKYVLRTNTTPYTVVKVQIGAGYHYVTTSERKTRFGAIVFGILREGGYGFPVGFIYGPDTHVYNLRPCEDITCSQTNTFSCESGFLGNDCEEDADECLSNPCGSNGKCLDELHGYTCTCLPGYFGTFCEHEFDECISSPCINGGTCEDESNGFTCVCLPGFNGTRCQNDIDECVPDPCKNSGECHDKINGYSCSCIEGFIGDNCQTALEDIDDCVSNPCQNGGRCVDKMNGFTCSCAAGTYGSLCEFNKDDCAVNPCRNGGTCLDGINKYTCTCKPWNYGKQCQYVSSHLGREFYIAVPQMDNGDNAVRIHIVVGTDCRTVTGTECRLRIKFPNSENDYDDKIMPGLNTLNISSLMLQSENDEEHSGILLTTNSLVTVIVTRLNSDSYLALPSVALGTDYSIFVHALDASTNSPYYIVGTEDNTTVTLGDTRAIDINKLSVFRATSNDSHGRFVFSGDKSFALIQCSVCTDCGNMVEQVIPSTFWSNYYVVPALDPIIGCKMTIDPVEMDSVFCTETNGAKTCSYFTAEQEVVKIVGNQSKIASSTTGIRVVLYCNNFSVTIPSVSQYIHEYQFGVPEKTNSENTYLVIIIATAFEEGLLLDGTELSDVFDKAFVKDDIANYTVLKKVIDIGYHNLTHEQQDVVFGALVYSVSTTDGFGFPLGFRYGPDKYIFNLTPCQDKVACSKTTESSCASGMSTTNCSTVTNACRSSPCRNGGTCLEEEDSYSCLCKGGYFGRSCELEFNECDSNPCLGGGTCEDIEDGFNCVCTSGFVGERCEREIDACSSNPCENKAVCMSSKSGITCSCNPGYTGIFCQTEINECDSDPCKNGAACRDMVNGYKCMCRAGYSGESCEEGSSHVGREFYVGIPYVAGVNAAIRVDIASTLIGQVLLEVPVQRRKEIFEIIKGLITVYVNSSSRKEAASTDKRGIRITTDVDVAVFITVINGSSIYSRDTFLAFPTTALGHYYQIKYLPNTVLRMNFAVIIIGIQNNTNISIDTKNSGTENILSNSFDVHSFKINLNDKVTFSTSQFSFGLLLEASCASCNYILEHVIPLKYWTNVFIIPSLGSRKKHRVQVIAQELENTVCISNQRENICNVVSESFVIDESVVLGSESAANVLMHVTDYVSEKTFILTIPGISNYLNEYSFVIPTIKGTDATFILVIIIPASTQHELLLDGHNLTGVFDQQTISTEYLEYIVFKVLINAGFHSVHHIDKTIRFGAVVYLDHQESSWAFPLGFGRSKQVYECQFMRCTSGEVCKYTCSCPSGYTGNACEIDVDECLSRPCKNSGICVDLQDGFLCTCSPGYFGLQCEKVAGNIGFEYHIGTVRYSNNFNDIRIDVVASETGRVTLDVPILSLQEVITIKNNVTVLRINSSVVTSLTDQVGIRLRADVPISVFITGIDYLNNLHDTYIALPNTALDKMYEILPQPVSEHLPETTLLLLGCKNDTTVDVEQTLTINSSQVFLDSLEVMQYSNYRPGLSLTMTGTNSFSLLLGSVDDEKMLMLEQMIPVRFWTNYFVIPNFYSFKRYVLHLSSPNNLKNSYCLVRTSGSYCEDFDLSRNSEVIYGSDPAILISKYHISVVQYSLFEGQPNFMMTVPGVSNYRNDYAFTIPSFEESRSTHHLCIIVPSTVADGLALDADTIHSFDEKQSVSNKFSSYSIRTMEVESGFHRIQHKLAGIKFGAFVYGIRNDIGYGFAVGFDYGRDLFECSFVTCQGGNTCDYMCSCTQGLAGVNCITDIRECESNPCVETGRCEDTVDGYLCSCEDGYTGTHCEENIDECMSSPCHHGSRCIDGINDYECVCVEGFGGHNCAIEINECLSSPCNNGSCTDRFKSYSCTCNPGFTGNNCEIDIDECESDPCMNDAACHDGVNGYTCRCISGFLGENCNDTNPYVLSQKDDSSDVAIGVTLPLLIVLCLVTAATVFYIRRRNLRNAVFLSQIPSEECQNDNVVVLQQKTSTNNENKLHTFENQLYQDESKDKDLKNTECTERNDTVHL